MSARLAAVGLVILTALLLAGSVLPPVAGFRPDVLALVVLAFALADGPATGVRVGFATGLAADLLAGGDVLVGASALVLVLLGDLAGRSRGLLAGAARPRATGPVPVGLGGQVLAGALAGAGAGLGHGLLTFLLDPQRVEGASLLQSAVGVGVYTAVLAPLVLRPLFALARRVPPVPVSAPGAVARRG